MPKATADAAYSILHAFPRRRQASHSYQSQMGKSASTSLEIVTAASDASHFDRFRGERESSDTEERVISNTAVAPLRLPLFPLIPTLLASHYCTIQPPNCR